MKKLLYFIFNQITFIDYKIIYYNNYVNYSQEFLYGSF